MAKTTNQTLRPAPKKQKAKFVSRAVLLLLAFGLMAHVARGNLIGWHPDLGGDLGLGLDLRNEDIAKPPVALFDTNVPPYSGTGEQSINVRFVQHALDMSKSFFLNANVSLSYEMYSGKVGFDFIDSQTFSANQLTFLMDCTRDFGQSKPAFLGFDPHFINVVASLKQTLNGDALQKAITDRFGTHTVYGYQGVAKVAVAYQFDYSSLSVARSMQASVEASYASGVFDGDFDGFVQSQFQQTDTHVTLNCRFWSSDPYAPPGFPVVTNLTTYDQFVAYASKVQNYCASMVPARAKKTAFLVEPLQSLPGYYELVGSVPAPIVDNSNVEQFNQLYSRLKAWENLLSGWVVDAGHMSWLNNAGQQQVHAILKDVTNYRKTMEQNAKCYFETGCPLNVPSDIINYFVNFNRIRPPAIYTLASQLYICPPDGSFHELMGYVSCGSKELTVETPFLSVAVFHNGKDEGIVARWITYSPSDFEKYFRDAAAVSPCTAWNQMIADTFSSAAWASLKSQAQTNRILFFAAAQEPEHGAYREAYIDQYSFVIRDNAGTIVDQMSMASTRSAGSLGTSAAASPEVDLSIGLQDQLASTTAGTKTTYTFGVTNNGSGAAYRVQLIVPLINTNLFDVLSLSGSQGQGIITNGSVVFDVGPLASGYSADIRLQLVPIVVGAFTPAIQSSVAADASLSDPYPSDNIALLTPISSQAPALSIFKKGSQVELSWSSDTSRIILEQTTSLSGPNWTPVSGALSTGSQWKIDLTPARNPRFFRLHGI